MDNRHVEDKTRGLLKRIFVGYGLVVGFMVFLLFPNISFNREDVSIRENRRLAQFPAPSNLLSLGLSRWCGQFGAAFEDRFFGRNALMDLHDTVKTAFDDRGNDHVLIGLEGWMYLRSTLLDYANVAGIDEDAYVLLRDKVKAIASYARRRGKTFVFFIVPDKCRVYPEYVRFQKKLRPDTESHTERLVARLRHDCDFPIIYPRDEFVCQARKMARPIYYRDDTHWTDEGAYFGYLKTIEAIMRERKSGDAPRKLELGNGDWEAFQHPVGDLARMLQRDKSALDPQEYGRAVFTEGGISRKRLDQRPPLHSQTVATCAKGSLRLFCMGDSFSDKLPKFLERSFSDSFFKHVRDGIHKDDLSRLEASDVVLMEVVERNLCDVGQMSMHGKVAQSSESNRKGKVSRLRTAPKGKKDRGRKRKGK